MSGSSSRSASARKAISTPITARPNGARRRAPIPGPWPSSPPRAAVLQRRAAAISVAAPIRPDAEARCAFLLAQLDRRRDPAAHDAGREAELRRRGAKGFRRRGRSSSRSRDYDPVLARIERLVPGTGPLAERVEAFQERFTIPRDRLEPVMRAAIAECRRRTVAAYRAARGRELHAGVRHRQELARLQLVQGRCIAASSRSIPTCRSRIEPRRRSRLPRRLSGPPRPTTRCSSRSWRAARGWVEYHASIRSTRRRASSPRARPITASSSLFPATSGSPSRRESSIRSPACRPIGAADYLALQQAIEELAGARFTIARDYLDGRIGRAQAIELTQRYQLRLARARRAVDRLHRPVPLLRDQLRPRPGRWSARLRRSAGRRSRGALGGDGGTCSPSRPCRAISPRRPLMRVFFDARQLAHAPAQELHNGAFVPFAEHPGRAEAILAALGAGRAGRRSWRGAAARRPSEAYLAFLWSACAGLARRGPPGRRRRLMPGRWCGRRPLDLDRIDARLGHYSFDASSPIAEGTWESAYWSAQTALTALDAVLGGERAAFAALPAAGPSCRRRLSRRLLLPQQCRDRRRGRGRGRPARRDPRRRLSSRQRHPGHLLRARRRAVRLDPRRSAHRLSLLLGPCRRDRRRRRARARPSTCRCRAAPASATICRRSTERSTRIAGFGADLLVCSLRRRHL